MLDASFLDYVPDALVYLWSQAESDILVNMAIRISAYNMLIPAAEHQFVKLLEMGLVDKEIVQRLAEAMGKTQKEVESIIQETASEAIRQDMKVYRAAGLSAQDGKVSQSIQNTITAGIRKTNQLFQNLTRSIARTASKQFENALDQAYMQASSGAFSQTQAIRNAIESLSRQGISAVKYPSGRVDSIDVSVRRAVLTGVNQTAAETSLAYADTMGCDLVEVSAHAGARPSHQVWQGGIYSRSGANAQYPDFVRSTGYGSGEGLCGWNCHHSFGPYYPGTARTYTEDMLKSYDDKSIKYNGELMTEYEASQKQRDIERNIRRWKREYLALDAAGLPTEKAAAKLSSWNKTQRDFIAQTGLKQQYDRTSVSGFGRSEAAKATAAARKLPLPRTVHVSNATLQATVGLTSEFYGVVPKGAELSNVVVIAGRGTSTAFRHASQFAQMYGGDARDWVKKVGLVTTDNFVYDIHWNEYNGNQYEHKTKGVKKL